MAEEQLREESDQPLDEISKKIMARAYNSGGSQAKVSQVKMRPTMMRAKAQHIELK